VRVVVAAEGCEHHPPLHAGNSQAEGRGRNLRKNLPAADLCPHSKVKKRRIDHEVLNASNAVSQVDNGLVGGEAKLRTITSGSDVQLKILYRLGPSGRFKSSQLPQSLTVCCGAREDALIFEPSRQNDACSVPSKMHDAPAESLLSRRQPSLAEIKSRCATKRSERRQLKRSDRGK
jgi:hypothetical protein